MNWMVRRLGRLLLVPLYLLAILLLASWQSQLSLNSASPSVLVPVQPDIEHHHNHPEVVIEQAVNNSIEVQPPVPPAPSSGIQILGNPSVHLYRNPSSQSGPVKEILIWTGGFGPEHLNGCPEWRCSLGGSRSAPEKADAIIFHNGVGSPPSKRSPDQYYVFFTQESPIHASAQEPYEGFYNLTMGFRRDADMPCPYGYATRRKLSRDEEEMKEWTAPYLTKTKSKMVAWFSSNCHAPSGRDRYVAELSKHVSVDVYGACGTLKCPKSNKNHCLNILNSDYRFYLAFENSICKDYVTEKYWEKAATMNVIPVVLKRSILEPYAPPHSFIAADDFPSAADMGREMKKIADDPLLYASYFQWKRHYDVIFLNGREHDQLEQPWGFCRLCAKLWAQPRPSIIQSNIQKWWRNDASCDGRLVDSILMGKKKD